MEESENRLYSVAREAFIWTLRYGHWLSFALISKESAGVAIATLLKEAHASRKKKMPSEVIEVEETES